MKKSNKKIVIVSIVFVFGIAILPFARILWDIAWTMGGSILNINKRTKIALYETDHKALLDACREIMDADKTTYRRDPKISPTGDRYPDPQDPNMPAIIRNLGVSYIVVDKDEVRIEMGGGHYHYGFTAFRKGFEQYGGQHGGRKLIDGLWFD